ncbi:lipoyl(octanoyl) transferase [Nitrosomonas sp. PY1]|uniref:lipoyl(octanoyl) transferase LipB n=1 Tax=Nitrosomonas sp. PY1 TaxID=1803906 RepID=UPI001FC8C085|nr:lipoyl(octanoyl) transferase LipB [Nitrosomonas sp. PY1]GKS69235.1 lipoyl(octanoyl) transferase [Nitrosomonas sp. PY1]
MLHATSAVIEQPCFLVKKLGLVDYCTTWQAMKDFTATRTKQTHDEIWLLQHTPVFTQGIAGKPEHILNAHNISVIKTDRGGQITYHGPGQIIAYLLLDIHRLKIGVRELIRSIENAVIGLLAEYNVSATGCIEAPGVYVGKAKIASMGLKIKKNFCYHGIALNVDMDLEPFTYINPCGYPGLRVTQTKDLGITDTLDSIALKLAQQMQEKLLHRNIKSS